MPVILKYEVVCSYNMNAAHTLTSIFSNLNLRKVFTFGNSIKKNKNGVIDTNLIQLVVW